MDTRTLDDTDDENPPDDEIATLQPPSQLLRHRCSLGNCRGAHMSRQKTRRCSPSRVHRLYVDKDYNREIRLSPEEIVAVVSNVEDRSHGETPLHVCQLERRKRFVAATHRFSKMASTPMTVSGVAPTPVTQSGVAPTPVTLSGVAPTPVTQSGVASTPVTQSGVASTPVTLSGVVSTPHMVSGAAPTPLIMSGSGFTGQNLLSGAHVYSYAPPTPASVCATSLANQSPSAFATNVNPSRIAYAINLIPSPPVYVPSHTPSSTAYTTSTTTSILSTVPTRVIPRSPHTSCTPPASSSPTDPQHTHPRSGQRPHLSARAPYSSGVSCSPGGLPVSRHVPYTVQKTRTENSKYDYITSFKFLMRVNDLALVMANQKLPLEDLQKLASPAKYLIQGRLGKKFDDLKSPSASWEITPVLRQYCKNFMVAVLCPQEAPREVVTVMDDLEKKAYADDPNFKMYYCWQLATVLCLVLEELGRIGRAR